MSIITISRQFGAGGKQLSEILSRETGYPIVDSDIVEKIAAEAEVSRNQVRSVEADTGSLLRFITGIRPFGQDYLDRLSTHKKGFIDGYIYVDLLFKIIPEIAKRNNLILIGRGGQYILADHPNVFHLLLTAHPEDRISFLEKTYNIPPKQAKQVIAQQEKRRQHLFRYFGRNDYDDPHPYHMVLNMSRVRPEKAVASIMPFVG